MHQDVKARDRDRMTPLHCAAIRNMADRCEELIEMGADIQAVNRWGATPLDCAKFALSDDAGRAIARAAGVDYEPLPQRSSRPTNRD